MKTVEILKKAKALIEDPEHWTQHALARDESDEPVMAVNSRRAVAFCSAGALLRVTHTNALRPLPTDCEALLNRVASELADYDRFIIFNDNSTHAEVMKLWDRAIEIAGEAQCS